MDSFEAPYFSMVRQYTFGVLQVFPRERSKIRARQWRSVYALILFSCVFFSGKLLLKMFLYFDVIHKSGMF